MTDSSTPAHDDSTLDARRTGAHFEVADDGSSYRCTRVFGAPPERVFRAFTDPADLRVWFPAGAPPGSDMTVCESDPTAGGTYHYEMVIPEHGTMVWHGTYTALQRPDWIESEEWFVMGGGDPTGDPSVQRLTFELVESGRTRMTMDVRLPTPEDPDTLRNQAAEGLGSSLSMLDRIVSA